MYALLTWLIILLIHLMSADEKRKALITLAHSRAQFPAWFEFNVWFAINVAFTFIFFCFFLFLSLTERLRNCERLPRDFHFLEKMFTASSESYFRNKLAASAEYRIKTL